MFLFGNRVNTGLSVCLSRYSVIVYVRVTDSDSAIWRAARPDKSIDAKAFFTGVPLIDTTGTGQLVNLSMILKRCKNVGLMMYVFLRFLVVGRVAFNIAFSSCCDKTRPTEYTENNISIHNIAIYTNRSLTNWACSVIKRNRNSGFLPINSDTIVRVFSVSSMPSSVLGGRSTRINRRVFGDIVVSFNWFGIISPNPLNREISTFLFLYFVVFKCSSSSSVST